MLGLQVVVAWRMVTGGGCKKRRKTIAIEGENHIFATFVVEGLLSKDTKEMSSVPKSDCWLAVK